MVSDNLFLVLHRDLMKKIAYHPEVWDFELDVANR